ncbi:MAG: acylphosphatase [Bacteroidetes bacterium]|nr:acylphosphatase [Bacteroidota bacterium]MBU1113683.1 acylphosphatase [Bacteroidota bacterium]MBU1799098.1 acylphosphatase [Bacteroidota bacterium]
MSNNFVKAEITVSGLVQGVGFRYFVYSKAQNLGLTGYTKNMFSGEVYTVVEGEKYLVDELIDYIKIGPSRSHVRKHSVNWLEYKNEFNLFEIKY